LQMRVSFMLVGRGGAACMILVLKGTGPVGSSGVGGIVCVVDSVGLAMGHLSSGPDLNQRWSRGVLAKP
jgi:hypothetical protein